MSFFDDAKGQLIDEQGKTRIILFPGGIYYITEPIRPLDNVEIITSIHDSPFDKIKKFVNRKGGNIIYQDLDKSGFIKGVWISFDHGKGYIPCKKVKAKEDLEVAPSDMNDYVRTGTKSSLGSYNKSRKIAEILKQYTLYEYSFLKNKFNLSKFVIDDSHSYDLSKIGKKLIRYNKVVYRGKKIIVPSEKVAEKLMNYLTVQLINDEDGVLSYKNREVIKSQYTSLEDFKHRENQLVFINKEGVKMWKKEVLNNVYDVKYSLNPFEISPIFYQNANINNGKTVIIQNVNKHSFSNAYAISSIWKESRINIGYYIEYKGELKEKPSVYSEDGLIKEGDPDINILMYGNNEYAAAMLFI